MKKITMLVATLLAFPSLAVDYTDTAKIISTKEVYRDFQVQQPYQYCREVAMRTDYRGDGSATNELIGGIIGGAIGNQFGKGSGKDVTTIAGALLGASIANDGERRALRDNNSQGVRTKEVCETRYRYDSQRRFSHYLVTYSYKGVDHTYESSFKPKSDKVSVRISVRVEPDKKNYRRN